jgi:hypothetical protein
MKERSTYRVIKTLRPTDRGALELAQQYGPSLVCVRHRADGRGKIRYTTVELVISSQPMKPRAVHYVHLRTQPAERDVQAMIRAAGGIWDFKQMAWRLPSRVASILKLRDRICEETPNSDPDLPT